MAKGQVTTDDLATGIKSFGGLASLGGAPRPVRDNPFRDTRTEPAEPVVAPPAAAEPAAETRRLEVVTVNESTEVGEGNKTVPVPRPARERKPAPPRVTKPVPAPQPRRTDTAADGRDKKTEVYTERITVALDADLRDGAEALARELQRRRSQKGERITTNTVIRVALRTLLETFDPSENSGLNTEADVYEAVLAHRARK